jgi:lysophospholipase L1-like esterase
MTLDCLLPAMKLTAGLLAPCVDALRARHDTARLSYYCAEADFDHYASLLDGSPLHPLGEFAGTANTIVALTFHMWPRGADFDPPHSRPLPQIVGEGRRLSILNLHGHVLEGVIRNGRLELGGHQILAGLAPHHADHVFGRLAPRNAGYLDLHSLTYFPYGYLMRTAGIGVTDAFGFRIAHDYAPLATRPVDHILIAVLGGSSAFSVYCDDRRMFSAVLEHRLSEYEDLKERHIRVTVLNFGAPGHVVLNELTTYLLFVERLRPDFVIAHDGINDCHYGLINDPFLLGRHQIAYPDSMEKWAQILHGSTDRDTSQAPFESSGHLRNLNSVTDVAKAFVARKRQFKRIVELGGGRFVWALQPAFFSKHGLSEREALGVESYTGQLYRDQAKQLPELFRLLSERVAHDANDIVVDLHRQFGKFGAETTLFADHVHLLPAGDAIVADIYANALYPLIRHAHDARQETSRVTA